MTQTHPNSTGRFVVVFDSDDTAVLEEVAPSLLTQDGFSTQRYFRRLGIAVVGGTDLDFEALTAHCGERRVGLSVQPETIYYALSEPGAASFADTDESTWGLQAIRLSPSAATGAGIRLAVLDTGCNTQHPDFAGRTLIAESFIDGEGPEDSHGHGTHCIGTACGPRSGRNGRGYGVAPGVDIYSGKVLGADGAGTDTTILAGIDWALEHRCQVISMSLGADIREVHPPYVAAGRRALARGSLIVAAAGNNAARSLGNPGFVGAPANSPYIMAVGAVDQRLNIADFSARAVAGEGGEVDVAAPGVDVYSSWVAPQLYRSISGTSMATPHVSGIAALLAETTGARGQELWDQVIASVEPLNLPRQDVGAGLALAPAADRATPTPNPPQEQSWVITVDDERAEDLELVATELRDAGLTVTRMLPTVGIIYAVSTSVSKETIIALTGVASADGNQQHRVNPPDANIQ